MFTGGFLLFLGIFVLAFWMLIFLAGFALPYAITVWASDKLKRGNKTEEQESAA